MHGLPRLMLSAVIGLVASANASTKTFAQQRGAQPIAFQWLERVRAQNDPKGSAADKEANRKRHIELYNQLLPQLRPLVVASRQAAFDEHLKALQASDYRVVVTNFPDKLAGKSPGWRLMTTVPVPTIVGCMTSISFCFPDREQQS